MSITHWSPTHWITNSPNHLLNVPMSKSHESSNLPWNPIKSPLKSHWNHPEIAHHFAAISPNDITAPVAERARLGLSQTYMKPPKISWDMILRQKKLKFWFWASKQVAGHRSHPNFPALTWQNSRDIWEHLGKPNSTGAMYGPWHSSHGSQ